MFRHGSRNRAGSGVDNRPPTETFSRLRIPSIFILRILIKFLQMIPSQDENNNRIDFKVETLNTTIQRDKDNIPQSSILSHKYLNVILIDTFYYFYELIKIYNLREKPARRKLL